MKLMKFEYAKTDKDKSNRDFIALNNPSANYFGLDISEFDEEELAEVLQFLITTQKQLEDILANRTNWLKENGYGSYFRNFSKNKMNNVISEELK